MLGYTISKTHSTSYSEKYSHLNITVFGRDENGKDTNLFDFSWQSNKDTGYWYGFRLASLAHEIANIEKMAKLLVKFSKHFAYDSHNPENVLDWLQSLKIKRYVYDARQDGHVLPQDLLPESFKRYLDVIPGTEYCTVDCLARSEEEAKKELAKSFVKHGYHKQLVSWVQGGQEVRISHYDQYPGDVVSLDELLKI
jgi:hypothetical protein